ncbi:GNAT family N-acetyltransferase [Streptomyces sp. NPDC052225]|uniref:GNAT family N-acetyltransferase n=1 Tax=Streptomyces sp. NPDC052225 TaxID=3154949 RepID=UPI0034309251
MSSGIRRLGPSDVPACLALATDRGWPAEEARWRLLLEVGEGYGWVAPGGALVGAVVLTRFGTRAGVVGLMLVRADHGGRGIGRALMEHLLDAAREVESVFLYATDAGRPLYEKLGFAATHEVATHLGVFEPSGPAGAPPRTELLAPADARLLYGPDAAALGLDRGRLLRRLPKFAQEVRVLREPDGRVTGYAAAWDNAGRTAVGPVVAPDPATLCALVDETARHAGRPVRLECPVGEDATVRAWAVRHGLRETGRCTFMVRGRPLPAGRRALPYAPFMQSLG